MKKQLRLVRVFAHEAYTPQGKIEAPDGFHANEFPNDRFFTVPEAIEWFKAQIEGCKVSAIEVELDGPEMPSDWSRRVAAQIAAQQKAADDINRSIGQCPECGGSGVIVPPDSFDASGDLTPCPDPDCPARSGPSNEGAKREVD